MTPLSLLRLSKVDIAIPRFFTESDKEIPADILSVNESKSEIIIQSNKSLESVVLYSKIYAFNRIKLLKLKVVKELNSANQYVLKVENKMESIDSDDTTNTYMGISIETPIPSLQFSVDEGSESEPTLNYKCHVISSDFLIVEVREECLFNNIKDCIMLAKEITLPKSKEDESLDIKILPTNILKLGENKAIVKIANNDECKNIGSIFDSEIKESFDKIIAKNTAYIHDTFNKNNQ
ncbi:hypothetical protein QTV49_000455 [Vibrio vulnificus]|nr:hypothetical protein [Vibrio vulnificus]